MDARYDKLDAKYTSLKMAMSQQKGDVISEISKLEQSLASESIEISRTITKKLQNNSGKLGEVIEGNKFLRQECSKLQDRLTRLETNQLNNNVILTGLSEQPWEDYKITKQRVIDTIAASLKPSEGENALAHVSMVNINHCSKIGKACPNYSRPISITFQYKEDKDLLMSNKKHLPTGIYANDKYPIHVKKTRDGLWPVYKMLEYKDNCRMEEDKLVINGSMYGIEDLGRLPSNLSAYLAAEKSDSETIVFHGKLSPHSNFHHSPFTINNDPLSSGSSIKNAYYQVIVILLT